MFFLDIRNNIICLPITIIKMKIIYFSIFFLQMSKYELHMGATLRGPNFNMEHRRHRRVKNVSIACFHFIIMSELTVHPVPFHAKHIQNIIIKP